MADSLRDNPPPTELTEQQLFSIYMKYPEITFDPEDLPGGKTNDPNVPVESRSHEHPSSPGVQQSPGNGNSSPASPIGDHDIDSSDVTCSTTRTTPLKHLMFSGNHQGHNEYGGLLADVESCELPEDTKAYYQSLGSQIVQIGSLLQQYYKNEHNLGGEDLITLRCTELQRLVQSSNKKCSDQIDSIDWITELAPFTIRGLTDRVLWSIYRQRTSLITQYLDLPSCTEYRLLDSLVRLHDAYIYHDFLSFLGGNRGFFRFNKIVSDLTVAFHNLLTSYKSWIRAMQQLRTEYMNPLMRRIQDSPWIRREIEQTELSIDMAKMSLKEKYESGEISRVLQEDQERGAEMLADRRSKSNVLVQKANTSRTKSQRKDESSTQSMGWGATRVRREQTL